MKPCPKNRKLIAWMVLDALEAREATALRAHFAQCEGCRRYHQEISDMAARVASAAPESRLEASESFLRRVEERLKADEFHTLPAILARWFRGLEPAWRLALPALGVVVVTAVTALALRQHSTPPLPDLNAAQGVPGPSLGTDPAPTLANYRMVACQSVDKLSELLTRQGNRPLPPAPIYTASSP